MLIDRVEMALGEILGLASDDRDRRDEIITLCDGVLAELERRPPVTKRQGELLTLLRAWFATHEHGPSYEEMRIGLGLKSRSQAFALVVHLERCGYVRRHRWRGRGQRRGITLLGPARQRALRPAGGTAA